MNPFVELESFDKLLNVGCGAHFHKDWHNLDLVSNHPSVAPCDIRQGLPFSDGYFDGVYHSHLLEHLTPQQGEHLLVECHRVLRQGGVLRIVVPDLEKIAKLYLDMLQKAWLGDPVSAANYEWMKLELLDQLVRQRSGGMMGPYMLDPDIINFDFVKSRIGKELEICQTAGSPQSIARHSILSSLGAWFYKVRSEIAKNLVCLLLGREQAEAFAEGLFRQQGEVHRWMYDRYSLMNLCDKVGFGDFRICLADESMISGFERFQLDQHASEIRKPDSLFVECRKAAARMRIAA